MDPLTAFVIASLMMLLNGGVLGLMHRDLPEELRPSAFSWRLATLLLAGGCILLTVQRELPAGFILPFANGLLMFGLTGYWLALRQFDGAPGRWWMWLPCSLGTLGIAWYAAVQPGMTQRVAIATIVWLLTVSGSLHSLWFHRGPEPALSRKVMIALMLVVAGFMLARLLYFLLNPQPVQSVMDPASWMNLITPMMAAILPVIGTTAFLLLISERLRRQWEHAASTDYLTGLANRRTLASVGADRLRLAQAARTPLAVAVIDIDHFKSINDRFGHDFGDLALKHVAAQLQSACRRGDLAARQGGEEFVVLFDGLPIEQAAEAAERIRTAVAAHPFQTAALQLPITVSIGVAGLRDERDLDALLSRADQALYAAKAGGRNRVEPG